MAIAYEQSRLTYGSGDTVPLAFTSNVKSGSLLLVVITQWQSGGITADSTVSDSQGNQYNKVGNRLGTPAGMGLEMWYAFAGSAGANTVTVNGQSNSTSVAIHEFSGIASSNFIDVQDTNNFAAGVTNVPNGGPIDTTNAADLLVGALTNDQFGDNSTEIINPDYQATGTYSTNHVTIYSGHLYVSLQNGNINHQPDNSPTYWEEHGFQMQEYEDGDLFAVVNTHYKIVASTGTYYRRWWQTTNTWASAAWAVAFKASGGTTYEDSLTVSQVRRLTDQATTDLTALLSLANSRGLLLAASLEYTSAIVLGRNEVLRSYSGAGAYAFGEQNPTQGEQPISWQTWSNGSGSVPTIQGDQNWGRMQLNTTNDQGRSAVYDLGSQMSYLFTLTKNRYGGGTGTATMQIRGSTGIFGQDDLTPVWSDYLAPVTQTWRYVQVRDKT